MNTLQGSSLCHPELFLQVSGRDIQSTKMNIADKDIVFIFQRSFYSLEEHRFSYCQSIIHYIPTWLKHDIATKCQVSNVHSI